MVLQPLAYLHVSALSINFGKKRQNQGNHEKGSRSYSCCLFGAFTSIVIRYCGEAAGNNGDGSDFYSLSFHRGEFQGSRFIKGGRFERLLSVCSL